MVTQAPIAVTLSSNENSAVREFLSRVREAYGEKVIRAALFGSKARRDSSPYSDIDILLIVAEDDWKFQKSIIEIGADISLEYDVLLDIRVMSASRWQYLAEIQAGIYQNIMREAIPLE